MSSTPDIGRIAQALLPVFLVLAPLITAIKAKKQKQQAQRAAAPPKAVETDEAERTRRVQEEVRRKIAARGRPVEPLRGPEGPERRILLAQYERRMTEASVAEEPAAPPIPVASVPSPVYAPNASAQASAPSETRLEWLSSLRHPESARRAIVLREVLGPPIGLR